MFQISRQPRQFRKKKLKTNTSVFFIKGYFSTVEMLAIECSSTLPSSEEIHCALWKADALFFNAGCNEQMFSPTKPWKKKNWRRSVWSFSRKTHTL